MHKDSLIQDQHLLLSAIQRGGKGRKDALAKIYSELDLAEVIRNNISKTSKQDTVHYDLLHDAFYTFVEKVKKKEFDPNTPIKPYILKAAKFHWYNSLRKVNKEHSVEEIEVGDIELQKSVEEDYISEELRHSMDRILDSMGKLCKKILTLWQENYSYKDIAKKMKLSSETNARKRRYRCYKELLVLVRANPELKNYIR